MKEVGMLGNKNVNATIAVKDLAAARKFYEGTLGLKLIETQDGEAASYKSGDSTVLVYQSQYAGTNRATAATWVVGEDLEGPEQVGVSLLRGDLQLADGRGRVRLRE